MHPSAHDPSAPPSQLQSADPADWPVAPGWQPLVDDFFASARGQALLLFLRQRLEAGAVIFPPRPLHALELTPPESVRVVILGQDPYHGAGQAMGLCFSVPNGVPPPPSLRNIFDELVRDLGVPQPTTGDLTPWAERGVLLLNAVLTVSPGRPASHAGKGWEQFTDRAIAELSARRDGIVFLLWGKYAREKGASVDASRHRVLTASHPSPYSVAGFTGCRHFSQANAFLEAAGRTPVDWRLP